MSIPERHTRGVPDVPDGDALREIVDRLAANPTCASCAHPLSAGFHYLRDRYHELRHQERAAASGNIALHPSTSRSCKDHARAMYAIYRRDHPDC